MANLNFQRSLPLLEKSLGFFKPHHEELRRRLLIVIVTIVLCSIVSYVFAEQLTQLFVAPLQKASPLVGKLVYTNLPEAFIAYLKVSFLSGLIISMPITIYQLWAFVAPGLHKGEKKLVLIVLFASTLLFSFGAIFAYTVALPFLLHYFMSYASPKMEPLPKFGMYLGFVARMLLTFGLAFEIPFLMVITSRSGAVDKSYFKKQRIYFYGAIIFLAFLLAGGDFMATALLSVPLFALYEVGIFGCNFFSKKK